MGCRGVGCRGDGGDGGDGGGYFFFTLQFNDCETCLKQFQDGG